MPVFDWMTFASVLRWPMSVCSAAVNDSLPEKNPVAVAQPRELIGEDGP